MPAILAGFPLVPAAGFGAALWSDRTAWIASQQLGAEPSGLMD
jgi:hypothetical protein